MNTRVITKGQPDNYGKTISSARKPIKSADKHFNYDEYLGDIYDSDKSNADSWSREEYNEMVETARGIFYPAVQKAANACHFTVSDNEAEYVAEKCVRCFFDNASWNEAVNRPEEYYVNSSRKSIKSDSDWHARNDYQNKEIYREAFASLVKDSDAQDFDNSPYGTVHYPGFYRVLVDGTYETEFSAETDEEAIQKFKDYFAESRGINNSRKPIKSSVDLETVANEMVQKLKNRGINATVEEDKFEGTNCFRISCPEGNSLTKQSANEVFFNFVDKYEPQGIAFEKDDNGSFYGEDLILMNGKDWWIDSSAKKPIKSSLEDVLHEYRKYGAYMPGSYIEQLISTMYNLLPEDGKLKVDDFIHGDWDPLEGKMVPRNTVKSSIIKSSLEDRLVPYLEEFEEGYANAITRDSEDANEFNHVYEDTFFEQFKSDYNLTDADIQKLEKAVREIWDASSTEEGEVRDMGEMYGAPRGSTSEEALKVFESKKPIKSGSMSGYFSGICDKCKQFTNVHYVGYNGRKLCMRCSRGR